MRIFDRFIFLKWPCNSAWGLFSRVFLQSPFLFQGCSLSWVSCMLTSEMNNVVLVCANHWSHSVGSFNIHYSTFPLFEFPSFVLHISKTLRREKKGKQCFHLSLHQWNNNMEFDFNWPFKIFHKHKSKELLGWNRVPWYMPFVLKLF